MIGLVYSFTNYTGVGAFQFIGLDNYQNLFGDSTFYDALFRTLLYAVLVVPLNFVLSLFIANLVVSKQAKGASVARVVFFIPWLISPIVVGVLWRWLFGENFGLINYVIEKLGGHAIAWQSNADLSLGVVVMAGAWWGTAFSMLLFIAAIKNVPVSYYEAASLDGATSAPVQEHHAAEHRAHLLHRHPAQHDQRDEGIPAVRLPQQRRTGYLEQPACPVHLPNRLQPGPDRLRERRVVRAHAHPDGRRDHPADRQPAGGEPMTTTDTPRPVEGNSGRTLSKRQRRNVRDGGLRRAVPATTLLWILAALYGLPVVWFVLSSFKPWRETCSPFR